MHLVDSLDLRDALLEHVLSQLGLRDLLALACTCSKLCNLIYQHDRLWLRSATVSLPPKLSSLPPKLSFLPALGRAAVQDVMQRRARASKNVLSGQDCARLTIDPNDGGVTHMQFSRSGTRLVIETLSSVWMYAVGDGSLDWHRHKVCETETFCFSPDLNPCCCQLLQLEPAADYCLQILFLDALTGNTSRVCNLGASNLNVLPSRPSVYSCWTALSPCGALLAVLLDSPHLRACPAKLVVLEAETCTVRTIVAFNKTIQTKGQAARPVWSLSSEKITVLGRVVHLQAGNIITFCDFEHSQGLTNIMFDMSGAILGFEDYNYGARPYASFADSVTGQVLLRAGDRHFVQFLTTPACALLHTRDRHPTFETWDYRQGVVLQAVTSEKDLRMPQLILDDVLMSPWRNEADADDYMRDKLIFTSWAEPTQSAACCSDLHFSGMGHSPCFSVDDCMMAAAIKLERYARYGRIGIVLLKLDQLR